MPLLLPSLRGPDRTDPPRTGPPRTDLTHPESSRASGVVMLDCPAGPPSEQTRFWAAACAAAAGLTLQVRTGPDVGPLTRVPRLTLICGSGGEERVLLGGDEDREGGGDQSIQLPSDHDVLLEWLLSAGPTTPDPAARLGRRRQGESTELNGHTRCGVVLCHSDGEPERPGLAWILTRLLSETGPGRAVDGRGPSEPDNPLEHDRWLQRLLSVDAAGAVVVDVGAEHPRARRLVEPGHLLVQISTHRPSRTRRVARSAVVLRVRGPLGIGTDPHRWHRQLRSRAAVHLATQIQQELDQRPARPATVTRQPGATP